MRTPVHTRAQRFKVPASLARSPAGAVLAVAAGALVYAGVTGKAPVPDWLRARFPHTDERGLLVIVRAVTIQRARDELYAFWRDFGNLPRFMGYLHDAEIVEDHSGSLIRWRSLPGAQVPNRGEVRFQDAPAGRGTEVRLRFEYDPPAGVVGATLAQALGRGADRQVRESLRNFKQLMEAGEIPTNDGQPMGSCHAGR
jgi:uncharacterized membrane protein